jgi:hypothetical protein
VHEVIWVDESGQVTVVASAAEVCDDPAMVVEAALVTCQLMGCTLGGTSVEHPSTIFKRS